MKRFLCTTAMAVALAGGVHASDTATSFEPVTFEQGDFYASNLIGMRIYNSETEFQNGDQFAADAEQEWDDIGEINDIIVSADGEVRAVILGVGGFLGIGEKDVSVSMDDIRIVSEENNPDERFLVVNTSKEVLENAPAYERNMETAATDATTATEEPKQTETAAVATDGTDTETVKEGDATAEATDGEAKMTETETAAATDAEVKEENTASNTDAEVKQEETAAVSEKEEMDANLTETAAANSELTRPQMQREGYAEAQLADIEQLSTEEIEGAYVYGINDETVGEIDTLLMSADGKVSEAVINVGGFLGLGEKPVAVSFDKIQILRGEDSGEFRFYIDSTEEKLESMEEYVAN